MKLAPIVKLLLENDEDHRKAQKETGFWGERGAGILFLSVNTNRLLLQLRSPFVDQPLTWGVIGGAIDDVETPKQGARREASEEGKITGQFDLKLLYIYTHDSGFKYYNFLGICKDEFQPQRTKEALKYAWFELDNLPNRLHFGVKKVLNDTNAMKIIKKYIEYD